MTKPRPQSQRPVQFTRRPDDSPRRRTDCERGHGQAPCGRCDRCQYEAAAYLNDHPLVLSLEELAHLC